MSKQEYFQKALADFTYETASGGAIRHLVDLGYNIKQIMQQLDVPAPYEKIQKTVWKHLIDTKIILLSEPGSNEQQEKVTYVKEYNSYGKMSFRKVVVSQEKEKQIFWKEKDLKKDFFGKEILDSYLLQKCIQNGEDFAYISCDFGWYQKKDIKQWAESLKILEEQQRDYLLDLPWEAKVVYHKLNQRMRSIIVRLYENNSYHGNCYFLKTEEKIIL